MIAARGLQGPGGQEHGRQAPPDTTPPQAPDGTAPAASSVHAGPLETQGSGPAAISLQPTCSPRTDGQGCWGAQRCEAEDSAERQTREKAGCGVAGSPPNPHGTPTSAPEGGPAPTSTKPPSALASPARTPTRRGAQQGHPQQEGAHRPAWPQPRTCPRHPRATAPRQVTPGCNGRSFLSEEREGPRRPPTGGGLPGECARDSAPPTSAQSPRLPLPSPRSPACPHCP